jgi:hypothetical protein
MRWAVIGEIAQRLIPGEARVDLTAYQLALILLTKARGFFGIVWLSAK